MRSDTIEANHRAMQRIARALLRDPEAADDAVQDAWVAALGRGGDALGPGWFRTVVRRLAWSRAGAPAHDRLADDPVDHRSGRSTSARAAALCAAIDALPPQYREVLERRYWADEPPRVIAARLGLDARVVRNRLHRAHVQLREALERREGRRGAHSMLVVIAGRRALRSGAGAGAAAAAATAGATKVAVSGAVAVLLIATIAALGLLGDDPGDAPGRGPVGDAAGTRAAEVETASHAPLRSVSGDPAAAGRARSDADAGEPDGESGGAAGAAEDMVWIELRVDVRDRASGQDVEAFALAFRPSGQWPGHATGYTSVVGTDVSEGRFAPGSYSMVVRADGYDDRDLGVVELEEGPVHDLGLVLLDRGSAILEGRIVSASPNVVSGLVVTATGPGRWTCVECDGAAPGPDVDAPHRCAACGFDGTDTIVAPDPSTGAFTIDQLVGGPLRVVVSERASGELLASRVVLVPPAATAGVEISIASKDVFVVLTDEGDEPFDGAWLEESDVFRAPITFHLWSDDLVSARAEVDPEAVGRIVELGGDGTTIVKSKRDLTGDLEDPDGNTAIEELWPDALPLPPGVVPRSVTAERLGPGRYVLRAVPASVESVQVGCGLYVQSPVRFREVPDVGEVAEVSMVERCGVSAPEVLAVGGVTCTSCHAAQGM